MDVGLKYLSYQPFSLQAFTPQVTFFQEKKYYDAAFYLTQVVPANAYSRLSKLPFIGGPVMKKNADKLQKINRKLETLGSLFTHFTNNQWIFESIKFKDYVNTLSAEELIEFQFDTRTISWDIATWRYAYGISKFVLKQDVFERTDNGMIIAKNTSLFQDVKFAFFND